jgi:DNA polymerase/3'-5' exonuclease PolX
MIYSEIIKIAEETKALLAPHCDRIEIAGSVRRKKTDCGDIELVCIPKPYGTGLFASGIALACQDWPAVKGEFPCKYSQRILPCGIKLDLFTATKENWGLIFMIRTGPWEFSKEFAGTTIPRAGYKCHGGYLHNSHGIMIPVYEEKDLFEKFNVRYIPPEKRT